MEEAVKSNIFNRVGHNIRDVASSVKENIVNNAKFYRKRLLVMALVSIFLMLVSSTIIAGYCAETGYQGWGMHNGVKGYLNTIFGTGSGFGSVESVKKAVNISINETSGSVTVGGTTMGGSNGTSTVYSIMKIANGIFKNFGIVLLILWFCISVFDDASLNQMFLEKFIKKLVFLAIGVFLISQSLSIIIGLSNIGSDIANALYSKVSMGTNNQLNNNVDTIMSTINKGMSDPSSISGNGLIATIKKSFIEMGNTVKALPIFIELFVPYIIALLCGVMIEVTCWSRFFEIILMAIMSPVAFADISKGSVEHSSMLRMLKNVLALAMTGAMIIIITFLCKACMSAIVTAQVTANGSYMTAVWQCVIISIAQMGLVRRSTEVVKSAMGII